jgi:CBS domain-containing protein
MSGGGIGGFWLVLIGFFVLTASRGAYQQLLLKDGLRGRQVADLMTTNPHMASPDMRLADLVDRVMLAHAISFVPVIANGQLVGQIDTRLVQTIPREDWAKRDVASVMVPVDLDCVVSPQMTAQDALARLIAGPARKLIVVDRGAVCGVLSLRDLLGHIAVVQALGGGRHLDRAGKAKAPPARKPSLRPQP